MIFFLVSLISKLCSFSLKTYFSHFCSFIISIYFPVLISFVLLLPHYKILYYYSLSHWVVKIVLDNLFRQCMGTVLLVCMWHYIDGNYLVPKHCPLKLSKTFNVAEKVDDTHTFSSRINENFSFNSYRLFSKLQN